MTRPRSKARKKGEERNILLAVANPAEWDKWLCQKNEEIEDIGVFRQFPEECLFCRAYENTAYSTNPEHCSRCMPGTGNIIAPCYIEDTYFEPDFARKLDKAIQRLERAGIFD